VRGASRSGFSQIDGEALPGDRERTRANKRLVARYLQRCLIGGRLGELDSYLDRDGFAQHDPDIPAGVSGLDWYLRQPGARRLTAVQRLAGRGNFVATAGRYQQGCAELFGCELYRIAEGRIVECWNTVQPLTAA